MDRRSRVNQAIRLRNAIAIDPYIFTRDAYLQYRDSLVHEGKKAINTSIF